ncbi:MAG: dTDP-glucose 4,6-dehydratase [Bacteroidia bacterium]|jgi:dTDP-glucose 4,6-dehydratase
MGNRKILITGGAGFIGSHVVRLFVNNYPDAKIFNLDKLTYAGNLENLSDLEGRSNYQFIKGDITDAEMVNALFAKHAFDSVIHLAAETHVDRSIESPMDFVLTNIIGTVNLLNACRENWNGNYAGKLFYHVSTDEVYGSLGTDGLFSENTPYDPQSPYSASKAGSDHFVRAYHNTYRLPVVLSHCSNNYGPNQFPEKLIPLCIHNIRKSIPLPVYGKGENIRDWLFVKDHAQAIDLIFHSGRIGETYNVGGNNETRNIDLIRMLCRIMDTRFNNESGTAEKLITFVTDRAGHDLRYAIDAQKITAELGWKPTVQPEQGLELTVDWYLNNQDWLDDITNGTYQQYYEAMYGRR